MKMKYIAIAILSIFMLVSSAVAVPNIKVEKPKDFYNDLQNLKDEMKETFKILMAYAKNHNVTENPTLWNPSDMFENTRGIMELCLVLFGHNPIGIFMGALCIATVCWLPFRLISLGEAHMDIVDNLEEELTIWCELLVHDLGVFGFLICVAIALPLALPIYCILMAINSRWYTVEAIVWCIQDAVQYCTN